MENAPPFDVGERVHRNQLLSWKYTGLSGKPGAKKAVRRFKKGQWVVEVYAHVDPTQASRVVSVRTAEQDRIHWTETRQRLMRHRE